MLGLVLAIRLLAGSLDRDRVQSHVRSGGGELLECSWEPFGPGWFGEKSDRIYEIVYRDAQGRIHRAHVKTSMLSGVYLTNDRVLSQREPPPVKAEGTTVAVAEDALAALQEENAQLRERIRRLEAALEQRS